MRRKHRNFRHHRSHLFRCTGAATGSAATTGASNIVSSDINLEPSIACAGLTFHLHASGTRTPRQLADRGVRSPRQAFPMTAYHCSIRIRTPSTGGTPCTLCTGDPEFSVDGCIQHQEWRKLQSFPLSTFKLNSRSSKSACWSHHYSRLPGRHPDCQRVLTKRRTSCVTTAAATHDSRGLPGIAQLSSPPAHLDGDQPRAVPVSVECKFINIVGVLTCYAILSIRTVVPLGSRRSRASGPAEYAVRANFHAFPTVEKIDGIAVGCRT